MRSARLVVVAVIVGAFASIGLAQGSPPSSLRQELATGNLIRNPGADAGPGGGGEVVPIPEWETSSGFTAVKYDTPGGYPTTAEAAPGGGANFFAGGNNNEESSAQQTIDLSEYAATIDAGRAEMTVSGWFGGFQEQGDSALLHVGFRRADGGVFEFVRIGSVTAAERGNQTKFLLRQRTATVPTGTRSLLVAIFANRTHGDANDGYADNVEVRLTEKAAAPPANPTPTFNKDLPYEAPAPGKVLSVESPLMPKNATTVAVDAKLDGAGAGTIKGVTPALDKEAKDLIGMCMIWGAESIDASRVDFRFRLLALFIACVKLLGSEADAASRAAQTGCRVSFVPMRPKSGRFTARERRRAVKRARALVRTSCARGPNGQLSFRVTARRGRSLRKVLGTRRLPIGLARSRTTADGPDPRLVVRWRR